MIQEDYVSFETAKLLKEKGFWENCPFSLSKLDEKTNDAETVRCPTIQMAMKWLREVHNLYISVEMGFDVDNPQYFFFVPSVCKFSNKDGEYFTPFSEMEFNTYEDAAELAIKYCLENLI